MYSIKVERKDKSVLEASTSEELDRDSVLGEGPSPEAVEFSVGNPRVEHVTGIVHLYRPVPHKLPYQRSLPETQPEERSLELCALAIPADMSVADFCRFCGGYLQQVHEMRVLRREGSQRSLSMVLLRFSDQAQADSFYDDYDGKAYCSLEPEIVCRLVYVRAVEVLSGILPPATAPPAHTELPSCPVCLERLDEHVSGIVTTVCNHRFHGECLQKWGDTSCPVCRYCMQSAASTSACAVCGTHADLWICLICGHVGCGRYKSGHANNHWKSSQHCYAMELETQRVWDYAGDGYVHRLIQSKTDGKLVEVPSPAPACGSRDSCEGGAVGMGDPEIEEALVASKLEAVAQEYNHLLTTQLDSQRQYFEGLLAQAMDDANSDKAAAAAAVEQQRLELEAAKAAAKEADRKRQAAERKVAEAGTRIAKLQEEKDFLSQLSENLMRNQKELNDTLGEQRAEVEKRAAAIKDLEEQVRDLMLFIEGQKMISDAGGELAGGTLLPVPEPAKPANRRRSKK